MNEKNNRKGDFRGGSAWMRRAPSFPKHRRSSNEASLDAHLSFLHHSATHILPRPLKPRIFAERHFSLPGFPCSSLYLFASPAVTSPLIDF